MRYGTVYALAGALVLAGCVEAAGGDAGAGPKGAQPVDPGDVDPDSDLGVVQGTIVSEETVPIVGAQVALQGTQFVTATDAVGAFVFRDVPPGQYALLVGALGYESAGRAIDVQAAQITTVSFVLRAIEVADEVFVEILHFVGFFECALATEFWISSCSYPYTAAWGTLNNTGANPGLPKDIQNNIHRFNFTIRPNIGQLQVELVWTPASAAATRMLMLVLCGDYDYVWDECLDGIRYRNPEGSTLVEGTSPIKFVVEGEEFYRSSAKNTEYDLTKYPEVWIMNYIGLPWGDPQVAFQQKFDVWDSVFYNGPGPDDWSVLVDG